MTIHAIIKEGKVVPTEPIPFADGTEVTIAPTIAESTTPENTGGAATLLRKFSGVIEDERTDLSTNHDHYLYGVPKKT